ncbi:OmcA/MtrC family decaheme c-type cytochrome [Photobacterium sp.]|uniref:OmcA/MtrC family decaheme c-type cytochrome n=1 Tax=Photobacterium sp. TaxID=660 RepID=UPI00299DD575|nr:OmcA/MtrC family decaheme c-type cytochrome [Photobacterium sp.]MDX1300715.1 OmcA/MtrC family decaheme c-type cytochrome [Photobacterium sp.]
MKNGLKFSRLGVIALLSLSLLACGGDGDGGDNNNDGGKEVIVPVVEVAERALVTINSVAENTDHTVTVHFSATNENDIALIGLSEPRFTVAKLVPEQDGKPSEWVSLINKVATSAIDDTTKELQATYDRDSKNEEGRFTDNGNGTYSFKLKETVLAAVNPLTGASIAWDANATHRVGMQISGNSNNTINATYDWVPSGNGLVDERNIVDTATCNNCHGELKLHGSRVETKYCVTCHNPGSTDPESGNSVDFTPMVHKIHRGVELPSMLAKGDGAVYEIIGYKGSAHTYAKNDGKLDKYGNPIVDGVEFPQDIRNCSNCHTAANEATPQGDSWKLNASLDACTSCHDDIAFTQEELNQDVWKRQHPNGFVDLDTCTSCHGANSGNISPAFAHETVRSQAKSAADNLSISFARVERKDPGLIEVDVLIKLYGAGIAGFEKLVGTADISFDSVKDEYKYDYPDSMLLSKKGYLLVNNDQGEGFKLSYGAIQVHLEPTYDKNTGIKDEACKPAGTGIFTCTIVDPGTTGVLSLVTTEMPICANGKSAGGDLIACNAVENAYTQVEVVPAHNVKAYYNLSDLSPATDYVEKFGADMASCTNCHNDDGFHITRHGATDSAECTNCHNATRSSFYAGRPADLKSHVHTLHANNDSSHPMDSYPADIATCTACHTDDQYDVPLSMNTRSSAGGGVYTSATVTVCASCHIKDMPVGLIDAVGTMDETRKAGLSADDIAANEKVIAHMIETGGLFGQASMAEADTAPELCAGCHAKGEAKGVDVTHGL